MSVVLLNCPRKKRYCFYGGKSLLFFALIKISQITSVTEVTFLQESAFPKKSLLTEGIFSGEQGRYPWVWGTEKTCYCWCFWSRPYWRETKMDLSFVCFFLWKVILLWKKTIIYDEFVVHNWFPVIFVLIFWPIIWGHKGSLCIF